MCCYLKVREQVVRFGRINTVMRVRTDKNFVITKKIEIRCNKSRLSGIISVDRNQKGGICVKNRKKYGQAAGIFSLGFAVCILVFLCWKVPEGSAAVPLKATLLKVGKADAIVLQEGTDAIVIDVGEEEDGEEMVEFLTNQGITFVETLIITHFDRDHVGGADTLVERMEIGTVLLPDYQGSHTEYADFMQALEEKHLALQRLTEPAEFSFGDAKVLVEPPLSYETVEGVTENDNNFSLITTVTHGRNRLLFTGDAEKQRLREWLDYGAVEGCSFLKIPHHGVYNTILEKLISAVHPEYAAICSSRKNPADTKTIEVLKQSGVRTFETKDGNITLISDGEHLELHQELEH